MKAQSLFADSTNLAMGYLDSCEPFSGWVVAAQKIKNVSCVLDSVIYKCEYGVSRPDVAADKKVVSSGFLCDGKCGFKCTPPAYYALHGFYLLVELENGLMIKSRLFTAADIDRFLLDDLAPLNGPIAHGRWENYLQEKFNKPGLEILEVGARRVSNAHGLKTLFDTAKYHGFDLAPGKDVDTIGDAHFLSDYYDKKFDLILCSAVFEHLALPWLVSTEIIKLLKLGGHVFVETHYSFSSHERPWHFFQFSEKALEALFPENFGMKCVHSCLSNPLRAKFSELSVPYLRGRTVPRMYCHSEYLGKKIYEVEDMVWDKKTLTGIYKGTGYPHKNEP